jgi:pyridoxal phosphate enzyme (YggS family)
VTEGRDAGVVAALTAVRERVAAAARRAGRADDAVTLVGATKTVDVTRVGAAVRAGLLDIGENRAQELLAKAPELAGSGLAPRWHFLGALQRNKVRALAPWVALWQSVDRLSLGETIATHAPRARVLVEVNLAGEPQKPGCSVQDAPGLVDALGALDLDVVGLMTVPPRGDDPRPWFARLRELGERLHLAELSMGMTDDFEAGIAEGATIVRVGRAIFGERPAPAAGR